MMDLGFYSSMFHGMEDDFVSALEVSKDKIQQVVLKRFVETTHADSVIEGLTDNLSGHIKNFNNWEADQVETHIKNFNNWMPEQVENLSKFTNKRAEELQQTT